MPAKFYNIFLRSKLFNRIILIYSTITIVTFCTLAVVIYQYSTDSMLQKELEAQTEAVEGAARYLDQQMDSSQEIVLQLYQNQTFLNDTLYFLRNDLPLYIQYRFNEYIAGNSSENQNVETFVRSHMESNRDILQMAIYSRSQSFLFVFNSNKTQKLLKLQAQDREVVASAIEIMQVKKTASERTPEIDRITDISTAGAYTFTFGLNDPDTLQNEGALLITYQPDGIRRMLETGSDRLMGSHLVLLPDGQVIYDSSGRYNGLNYPYFQQLSSSPGYVGLDVKSYTTTMRTAKSDINVIGIVPVSELENRYSGFKGRVIAVTSISILITIVFAYFAVLRYAKKTRTIVKAMRLAQQGNLTVRVPTGRIDELDEIAVSFNRMCEELTHYINQVYVSEIKQKHAELVAFQAQINPHFLYNTLEAIRMRALTQGAADVGEMTYALGSMFRYAIKPETVVTLEDEANYCSQFLELYKVRYREKIDYRITIDEQVKSARLFKLFLQPLVENAIVHGIQPTKSGNLISIRAFKEQPSVLIVEVEDNGKGMEQEKLDAVRDVLAGNGNAATPKLDAVRDMFAGNGNAATPSSLGLRNVNERIRLIYGKAYGLEIHSLPMEGTVIRARLPLEKGEK